MPMLELPIYPAPGLVTFDGLVVEKWDGPPRGDTKRWHIRLINAIILEPPDRSGRSAIWLQMDIVGKVVLASAPAEQRAAAEQLVAWVQQELTRRQG